MKMPFLKFNETALCRTAEKVTGLSDFGDSYFREGLSHLVDSTENDAKLHFYGHLALHRWIITHLSNRLRLIDIQKKKPEIFQRSIIPPIIITGLPRSGTTLLHRLLIADPTHHGVPFWELTRPIPPAQNTRDRRQRMASLEFYLRVKCTHNIDHIHFIRPEEPEGCMWMLGLTFVNLSFWIMAPVFSYLDWYMKQNLFHKKYHDYKALLHILQATAPNRRLVLKSPEHFARFDVLLKSIPEAMIIQTHRHPVTVTNSVNSLFYSVHSSMTDRVDRSRLADTNIRLIEHGITHNLIARKKYSSVVCDVYYEHLMEDPIGVIKTIYNHFGLPWPDNHDQRLTACIQHNPKDKYGKHHYKADDFGLTDSRLAPRFREYCEKFGYKYSG